MKNTVCLIVAIISLLWLSGLPVDADWINLSGAENALNIAEIHIIKNRVRIELEIFVNDMVKFDHLIPDSFFKGSNIKRPPLEDRIQKVPTDAIDPAGPFPSYVTPDDNVLTRR